MAATRALGGLLAVLALLHATPGALVSAQPFPNLVPAVSMSTNATSQGGRQFFDQDGQYITVRCSAVGFCKRKVFRALAKNMQACACKRPTPHAATPGQLFTHPVSAALWKAFLVFSPDTASASANKAVGCTVLSCPQARSTSLIG